MSPVSFAMLRIAVASSTRVVATVAVLSIGGCRGSSSSPASGSSISVSGPSSSGYVSVKGPAGTVSGSGVVHAVDVSVSSPAPCNTMSVSPKQDGSFDFAVCASAGDTIDLSFTTSAGASNSLGSFVVPKPTGGVGGSADANPCQANQRQLEVTNDSSTSIWVAGGGGALRAVCVVDSSTNCLPSQDSIDSATGACKCGTQSGTLACPASSKPTGNGGLNCTCATDSDCGSGAACNTDAKMCFDVLPAPTSWVGYNPGAPWNWEVPGGGNSVNFCLDEAGVSYGGTKVPSAVWWSGGVFARTGCAKDGTSCATADCNTFTYKKSANPNADCLAGVGGQKPYTLVEFTLQRKATDFYDVTVINGVNVGAAMAPIGTAIAPLPSGESADYWCKAPGSTCTYDFGNYTNAVPTGSGTVNYSALLMQTLRACSVGTGNPPAGQAPTGCPPFKDPGGVAYSCSGSPNATNGTCYKTCSADTDCPTGLHCYGAGDGQSYCQCQTQSDCQPAGLGQFCGTTYVPGLGAAAGVGSPQLFIQQCGSFAGWWTADDFCGNANNVIKLAGSTILDCGASITDGDGSATNLASLFGCNAASSVGQPGNPANQQSCYNASTSPTSGCCGCATDASNSVAGEWPNNATSSCAKNNATWASAVQPWLVNLKKACPTAYTYPYDDPTSTFQCQGQGTTNLLGYRVTFSDLPVPSSQ